MNDSFVEKLKGNAIFQLSLSSKELFHSNFLAWLAEDENTRNIFNQIMRNWLNDPTWKFDENQMMIKREYKNFDFCICEKISLKKNNVRDNQEEEYIPGSIIFVLENKFKSIPYKEQLARYHQRILELNLQGCKDKAKEKGKLTNNWTKKHIDTIKDSYSKTKYVLLNLAMGLLDSQAKTDKDGLYIETNSDISLKKGEPEYTITDTAKWQIATYTEYADCLKSAIENDENWKDKKNVCFYKELINKYCEFIQTFAEHINISLAELESKENVDTIVPNINWSILTEHQDFNKLRCYDVWQKLVMHKCAKYLILKIDNSYKIDFNSTDKYIWEDTDNSQKLYIGIGFYHGEAFLEFKYRLSENSIFCLQQQGNNTLSVGVVVRGLKIPKKKNKKEQGESENWNQEVENKVGKYYPTNIEYQGKKYYSYQGNYCSFFYYHLAEEDVKNSTCKATEIKEYSICKTLDKMVELMNIAIKGASNSSSNLQP